MLRPTVGILALLAGDFGAVFFAFLASSFAASYVESQGLAEQLMAAGSLGIVYPSVRRSPKTCIVCFRPALVVNVKKGKTYRFAWNGNPKPIVTTE